MSRPRVLLADDHRVVAEGLKRLLAEDFELVGMVEDGPALVAAAKDLARAGAAPTVAEAAEHARVSRATAYRYFPTQESLLVEVSDLTPMVAPVEDMLAKLDGDDVEDRIAKLIDA